jgi:hypothetical protein
MAASEGAEAAAGWLRRQSGEAAAKGRALAELALSVIADDLSSAAALGEEAAALAPDDPRLIAVMIALAERGMVRAPSVIATAVRRDQPLSEPQHRLVENLLRDAHMLDDTAMGFPPLPALDGDARSLSMIVCPPRSRRTHRVVEAVKEAADRGLDPQFADTIDDADCGKAAIVHLFADALDTAEAALRVAHRDGARFILDLDGVPPAIRDLPGSEADRAARLRLEALSKASEATIARNPASAELGLDAELLCAPDREAPRPDADALAAAFAEFGLDTGVPVIACIADLDIADGPLRLLRAFAALRADEVAGQLLVIGKGNAAGVLRREAERLDLGDTVCFAGMPAPLRWPPLFAQCSAAVFPDSRDMVLGSEVSMAMECALALGTPVAATGTAWVSQCVDPPDAFVLPAAEGEWESVLRAALSARTPVSLARPDGASLAGIYDSVLQGTVK